MQISLLKKLIKAGKTIPGAAILTIGLPGFFLASTLVAHAATVWSVPGNGDNACNMSDANCATIQHAVSEAATGDTVNVAAGTYTETVTVNAGITINTTSSANLVGEFDVDAAGTTISNFTINNPGGDFGVLINGVGNVSVSENTINDIGTTVSGAHAYGVWFQSSGSTSVSGIQIENNIISNIGNSSNPETSGGIGIGDSVSTQNITGGLVISGNTISSVFASTTGAYGIIINLGANGGASVTGASITSNNISTLTSTSGWEHAIGLETNTPGAVLTGNTVHNLGAGPADIEAVHFEMNPSAGGVTLTTDTFNGTPLSNSNATVTVNPAVPVIAEANTYPEALNGSVYNYIGLNLFPTIQAGVNGVASAGTVNVAAGTYTEQVIIGKPVTIIGAGNTTIIESPATLAGTFSNTHPYVLKPVVSDIGSDLTIKDLTINGDGQGNANYSFVGLGVENANTTVDTVTITSVRDNPLDGDQDGDALYVYNKDGTARTAKVTNSTFTDFQKNGITLVGTGLTTNVTGNTVTGAGPTPAIAQNGIQLSDGATGAITGNTVSGFECNDVGQCSSDWYTESQSAGILLENAIGPITVSGNTISASDMGIYSGLQGGLATIENNLLDNNRYFGIVLDPSGDAAISGGHISGSAIGILNPSEHNSGSVTVHGVDLSGNATAGVQNDVLSSDPFYVIDATGNWWGDASGPDDPTPGDGSTPDTNAGTGSPAVGAVDYGSWCVNSGCIPPPSTYTVTIDKFIDKNMATAASADSAAFPMVATWHAANIGAGTGSYTLSTVGFNSTNPYEAITSPMTSGASYTTNEDTTGAVVGPDCTGVDPFALTGYSTGATLADAESAEVTATVPNFTNLASDEYVIVWNHYCLQAPTLLSPITGTITTTAGLTEVDWNSVTDPAGGITYIYQSSNSPATNPDGSFTTPAYTSGPLSATMIPTPGTPAGVYYWHVMATDADGNVSPWSAAWTFTVTNTGTLTVNKNTIGGDGTFTFTGDNGLGAFSITTTGSAGSQTFNNVTPGTYTITETNIPKGWTQTDSDCTSVVVTAGGVEACTITDTINSKLGAIRGTKYVDEDGDGTLKDGDHHRLAGVTIYLDLNNNGVLDPGEPSVVTDKQGDYHFLNLPAGTYHVREVEQPGWIETVPAAGSYTIVLGAGKVSRNDNFGDFQLGTISGMKFNDLNGNGRKDKNEPGIAGWTITLTKLHSTFTETAVTDANGNYSFTNLGPGTYEVREVQKTGWHETTQNPPDITVRSGAVSKHNNFGNHFGKVPTYPWFSWFHEGNH